MNFSLYCLLDTKEQAEKVLNRLIYEGFDRGAISFIQSESSDEMAERAEARKGNGCFFAPLVALFRNAFVGDTENSTNLKEGHSILHLVSDREEEALLAQILCRNCGVARKNVHVIDENSIIRNMSGRNAA
jgi:hypothetical protein